MIKFANFEFIFAISGPKLARRGEVDKLIKHKIGGCSPQPHFRAVFHYGFVHLPQNPFVYYLEYATLICKNASIPTIYYDSDTQNKNSKKIVDPPYEEPTSEKLN